MADNLLTRKAGPLPTWGWMAIATGLALVFYLYEKHKSGSSSANTSTQDAEALAAEEAVAANAANSTQPNFGYNGPRHQQTATTPPVSTTTTSTTGTTTTGTTTSASTGGTTTAPKVTVPPMPSGVTATNITDSSVALKWNPSAGATSYRIRVTYQSKLVKQQTSPGTSTTVTGLGADHTYTFHVAAVNSAGTSSETQNAIKTKKS